MEAGGTGGDTDERGGVEEEKVLIPRRSGKSDRNYR